MTKVHFTADSIPDLSGKVAIVTGGNTGIGYETVRQLAKHGAKVIMASRTQSKAEAAIARLEANDPDTQGKVDFRQLDLLHLNDVVAAAKRLTNELERLDILVNNAGVAGLAHSITADGVEIQLQSNHIGPFCFTQSLLPLLQKTAQAHPGEPVRIVNVSSDAHLFNAYMPSSKPTFEHLDGVNAQFQSGLFSSAKRYGRSKLANLLYTKSFNERYSSDNIWAIATHPGVIKSDIWKATGGFASMVGNAMGKSTAEGAITSLFAATSPGVVTKSLRGVYITPGPTISSPNQIANNEKLSADLWKLSNQCLQKVNASS